MKRFIRFSIVLFVVVSCVIIAAALAGGLMEDSAFTPAAKGALH
ncbi:MAG: hypothetical protein FD125_537 [bacterium]|nr:MAG: hypothetical protein FD125_537 [bacterium]